VAELYSLTKKVSRAANTLPYTARKSPDSVISLMSSHVKHSHALATFLTSEGQPIIELRYYNI